MAKRDTETDLLMELDRCPACQSSDIEAFFTSTNANGPQRFERLLFEHFGLRWRAVRFDLCLECGLAFLNPRWTPHALGRIYGEENLYRRISIAVYLDGKPGATEADYFRYIDDTSADPSRPNHHHLRRSRWALAHMSRANGEKPLAADVGAGFGGAQRAIEAAGFRYRGFESSGPMVRHAATLGRTLENVPFAEVPTVLARSADLVYTAQFLEHVDRPVDCIALLRPCLVDAGYLFVDVPSCRYPLWDPSILHDGGTRRTAMNWGHMNLYDRESLANTFRLAGYDPVETTYDECNVWALGKLAAGPLPIAARPDRSALRRDVLFTDAFVEPGVRAAQQLRGWLRDAAGASGLLEPYRKARTRWRT